MRILGIMGMATVMTSTTMKPASLMEEIAVVVLLIKIIAQNVYAFKEEGKEVEELQYFLELHLEAAIRLGLLMSIVMISTII